MNCSAPRGTGQLKSLPASVVNAEIYVIGSNSKFLSKDVATEFRGRGDEIHMYPLSFGEFLTAYGLLYVSAENHLPGHKLRMDYSDGDPDFEQPFYILKHTLCPAVLTENLFMDNQEDCAFLLSATGRQAIIDLHIDGIIAYLNEEEPKPFK